MTISPSLILGGGGALPKGAYIQDYQVGAATYAGYKLDLDGFVYEKEGTAGSWVKIGRWRLGINVSSYYEARATQTGGAMTPLGATLATWWNCNSSPYWYVQHPAFPGEGQADLSIEIRDKTGNQSTYPAASVTLYSHRD